jgi:hypothetical protein
MLKIDNTLLQEVGLGGLPETEKNAFLKHIYETLEMRVGVRLADQMTNQQLDEYEQYFEAKDDAGAFQWLETNFPNYKDIVQQEFDKLKAEITQTAPQILSASLAHANEAQQIQQPAVNPAQISDPPILNNQPLDQNAQVPPPVAPQPYPYDNGGMPPAPSPQPLYPQEQPPAGPPPQPN